jgi:hypothetical protein
MNESPANFTKSNEGRRTQTLPPLATWEGDTSSAGTLGVIWLKMYGRSLNDRSSCSINGTVHVECSPQLLLLAVLATADTSASFREPSSKVVI